MTKEEYLSKEHIYDLVQNGFHLNADQLEEVDKWYDAFNKSEQQEKVLNVFKNHLFISYDNGILVLSKADGKELRIVTTQTEDKIMEEWLKHDKL